MTVERIYLVAVLFNSGDTLPPFLDSLRSQTFRDWRLIAIDNASRDGSADLVAAAGDERITVVRNAANLGFARAANQGLRTAVAASGRFYVLINTDTVFDPGFLQDLAAARDKLGAKVIAPRIMRLENPDVSWYAGGRLDYDWVFKNTHDVHDPGDTREARLVDFASGCCLGMTRDVLESVGLLDESFFVYWEDTDYCLRLKERGVPIVYVREPSLLHVGGASSGGESSPAYNRLFYKSYMQLLRKHFGLRRTLHMALRLVLKEVERRHHGYGAIARMATAMLRGMVAPLVRESRLDSGGLLAVAVREIGGRRPSDRSPSGLDRPAQLGARARRGAGMMTHAARSSLGAS